MDTNKMREQFEEYAAHKKMSLARDGVVVDYACRYTDLAWDAWKSSRAAVAVELPPKISAHNTSEIGWVRPEAEHYDEAIDDCREAIKAHGLKVAP